MDAFELLAECSITFAGFAAVYTALRGSQGARGAFRAWTTVGQGLQAFFYSLLPLILVRLGVGDTVLWRIASTLALAGVVSVWVGTVRIHLRLDRLGHPAQSVANLRLGLGLPLVAAALLLGNAAGLADARAELLYLLGVVTTLGSGVAGFGLAFWLPLSEAWRPGTDA